MNEKESILITKSLITIINKKNYIKIEPGFFKNAPELYGYYVDLTEIVKSPFYVILNNSPNYIPDKDCKKIGNIVFVIMDFNKLKSDIKEFSKEASLLLKKGLDRINIDKEDAEKLVNKKDKNTNNYSIPYGYSKDNNGNVSVNKEEASQVHKIFQMYSKLRSMRKVADILKRNRETSNRTGQGVDYSFVSTILHDRRYLNIKPQIVPTSIFKSVQVILSRNKLSNRPSKATFYR
jgi:hypothetical protein